VAFLRQREIDQMEITARKIPTVLCDGIAEKGNLLAGFRTRILGAGGKQEGSYSEENRTETSEIMHAGRLEAFSHEEKAPPNQSA
jgi:hypothetical protein